MGAFRVTFLMSQACFKPVTWYIEMYHMRISFLCGMTFSFYVMFIHDLFIFKGNTYHAGCLG